MLATAVAPQAYLGSVVVDPGLGTDLPFGDPLQAFEMQPVPRGNLLVARRFFVVGCRSRRGCHDRKYGVRP